LRQLTAATHALAAGKLEQAVPIQSRDEIGQLAQSFNQTAAALADAEIVRRQMLADIAHELRTPISVMRSHVEAMLDGVFETSPENLGVIHEETVLLGRLVDDLRILSLADAGQLPLKLERLNVRALFQQALMAFEPLAEADDVLIMDKIAGELPAIIGDPARLQQVLGNLITNALRHVRQGTAVMPTITLEAIATGPGVQIGVLDNGPGLSEIARARVFDRFWRADNARSRDQGGSGLGLAISQAIISSHQGQIWVESNPTQGSAFYFTLPREAAANNDHG
jgi:signal transduction histidine kinase